MKKILALLLLITVVAFSRTAVPAQPGRPFETTRHDINNIEMVITNYGTFGQHENGSDQGLWWPKGTERDYIYGAGSWFGTIVEGDTLVTIGYGPSGGQFEFAPGKGGWSVGDADGIIFKYPETWPSVPPDRLADVFPSKTLSHQDSWCAYNDFDVAYHMAGDTRPIGIEVYQTVYAWNLSTTADIIFIKFEVKNVTANLTEYYPDGPVTLTNCWFGVITDNDVGNEAGDAANDVCSGIIYQEYVFPPDTVTYVIDNLGYQFQYDEEPTWDPPYPGVIGFDYLQSPYWIVEGEDNDGDGILDQYEQDSAYIYNNHPDLWDDDEDGTPDYRDPSQIPQLGLRSFKRFTLDLEPGRDNERYLTMAGYNFVTGAYEPFDTVLPDPDDQRFGQCSGPFELMPDSMVTVLVGIVLADWMYPPDSFGTPDSALARVDATAQFIYDMNWLLPGPPPPPFLTCVPRDASVTLIWESVADPTSAAYDPVLAADPYFDVVGDPTSPLYDPYYKQYDFEGYGVWKSLDGQEWELLARYDLYNEITFDDPETGIYADNTGAMHYFVDPNVRNGFTYYYAVTTFDYNEVADPDLIFRAIWFEGGKVGVSTVPRREPGDYVEGAYTAVALRGNPYLADSNVAAAVTYPLQMTDDPFYLEFSPMVYDSVSSNPVYTATLFDADEIAINSVNYALGVGEEAFADFGTLNGLSISAIFYRPEIPSNISIFDRIEVTGVYPDSLIAPVVFPTNWAYRGSDYEVHWISAYGSTEANSAIVIDVYTGDTIPFQSYLENTATLPLAQGWCFRALTGSTDTLVYGGIPTGTRNMYICGGKFALKVGSYLQPGDPRPAVGDIWYVYARTTYPPAPANAYIEITPTPAGLVTEVEKLNVKVVPNPYIIANEWQQNFVERRMRFINLPAECTIRIFNLNGELVRSIVHHVTSDEEGAVLGDQGGDEWWDLLSDNRQLVASGVYIFHIESDVGEQVGKFVIIR